MEKHKLIRLVERSGKTFKNMNPTRVYREILDNKFYEALSHVLKAKDLVIFSLLVPRFNMGSDIDEDYDRIEYNMFTIELVEIYNSNPDVKCPNCDNGVVNCDMCDGTGEEDCDYCDGTGEEDCDYCDGSGVYEDGEECDMCEGSGRMTCGKCNGYGTSSCEYCGGDGEDKCLECSGSGTIESDTQSEVTYTDFVSWSGRWKMYFSGIKHGKQIDIQDADNFYNNSQTLVLRTYDELSEEYEGYDEGDTFLFRMNEKPDITQRDNGKGVIII
jgi:hypothetical protein